MHAVKKMSQIKIFLWITTCLWQDIAVELWYGV